MVLRRPGPILYFDRGLENVCEDLRKYERNSLSSKIVAVISSESDSGAIDGINKDLAKLLELFWVSRFMASKDSLHLTRGRSSPSWRTISLGPLCYVTC